MFYKKNISIIVPVWRGAIKYLPKLINSIPERDDIEIIVVDNSEEEVKREEILSYRDIVFLHSDHNRHAGGSRNVGMDVACGKWLLFADADDFFTPNAFELFFSMINSDVEIVYTKPDGIYEDTGEHSDRGEVYANLVHQYCIGETSENNLRLGFASPWCKMISRDLIEREKLRFDEIRAGNDIYFSLTSGYFAKKIAAIDKTTYIVTVNFGSLTKRFDYEVIKARLYSKLHCNQFLREHGFKKRQYSVMFALSESRHFGLSKTLEFICMIIKFRQNPFIGIRHWRKTILKNKVREKKDNKYVLK